jgi:hypothetical protein
VQAYKIQVGKLVRKRPLRWARCRRQNNIKKDLKQDELVEGSDYGV